MCRFVILSFRSRSTRNWARTLASVLKADASAWAAQSGRPFFWSIRIVRTGTTATSRSNLSASKAKGRLATDKVIAVAIKSRKLFLTQRHELEWVDSDFLIHACCDKQVELWWKFSSPVDYLDRLVSPHAGASESVSFPIIPTRRVQSCWPSAAANSHILGYMRCGYAFANINS